MDDPDPKREILSNATSGQSDKLARLGPFKDLLEANMAVNLLGEKGIHAEVANEHLAAALGPIQGAVYGGLFLLVFASEKEEARHIIADIDHQRAHRRDAESPACPKCNQRPSTPVIHGQRWIGIAMFALCGLLACTAPFLVIGVLLGLCMIAWPLTPAWECNACRHRFEAPKPDIIDDEDDPEVEAKIDD